MERFASEQCRSCGCRAEGKVTGHGPHGQVYIAYDPPVSSCACTCHAAWRFIHGVPVVPEAIAS
jgi:hypothetical protein